MTALYNSILMRHNAATVRPPDFARVELSDVASAVSAPAGAILESGSPEPWLDWMVR